MDRGTSPQHVQAVLAIDDRVLRNYWVTQTYSDLSAGLSALLAPDTSNWCTFGTWASCTVGRNLRGEDLPGWLQRKVVRSDGMMGMARATNDALGARQLDGSVHRLLPEHVGDVVREMFGACAMNLSEGNTEVFAEIAPAAATFITRYADASGDPATIRGQVLDACQNAPHYDGINGLQAGFGLWCDAMAEADQVRRSQLILAGSLHLGAHEQHHLQGPIAGSMDMGINQAADGLRQRLLKDGCGTAEVVNDLDQLLRPAVRHVAELWGELMTELLGTIVLPDGTLRLDHDVLPIPGEAFVPADLTSVVVPDLTSLIERFDRSTGDGHGSAAPNWVDFGDRMNFISNLFISRHHHVRLFDPPLASSELADIEADRPPVHTTSIGEQPDPLAVTTVPPSVGAARFTDQFVEELRRTGDEPADRAVAEYFRSTEAAGGSLLKKLASSTPQAVADEELPGIGEFLAIPDVLPTWVRPQMVLDGQGVFRRWGLQLGLGLFMASLPADYAFARGVQALGRTTRLTRNPKRRYVETGQMIVDVMTPGGLARDGVGYHAARHVRLMHAAVRHVLLHTAETQEFGGVRIDPWDPSSGLPISQLELLGTLFSFNVMGVEALERTGIHLSEYEAEAYVHAWNVVGHFLGIRSDLLPLSWADSKALWDERRRIEYGPTAEGRELTEAAISCMHELFYLPGLGGMPASGIRHFLGDETADLLGVPPADWTRLLFQLMQRSGDFAGGIFERTPGVRNLRTSLGMLVWQGFERYARDGERPDFEVTAELKESWGMS